MRPLAPWWARILLGTGAGVLAQVVTQFDPAGRPGALHTAAFVALVAAGAGLAAELDRRRPRPALLAFDTAVHGLAGAVLVWFVDVSWRLPPALNVLGFVPIFAPPLASALLRTVRGGVPRPFLAALAALATGVGAFSIGVLASGLLVYPWFGGDTYRTQLLGALLGAASATTAVAAQRRARRPSIDRAA